MFGTVAVAILFAAVDGKLVAASGLIDSLAFLLVKARVSGAAFCAVSFLLCCLLSMSTGTSVGTYVVSMPLLFPLGILVGADPLFLIGAVVSGGLFGDNLAPVSDTTIALSLIHIFLLWQLFRILQKYQNRLTGSSRPSSVQL